MGNEIFEKIKKFIYRYGYGYTLPFPLLFKKKNITRDTLLEKDLGITGDDADEFMLRFGKEFNINISQFEIGNYFGDEGDPILPAIIRTVTGKEKRSIKLITVGHLEKAVIAGRLDEEVINS